MFFIWVFFWTIEEGNSDSKMGYSLYRALLFLVGCIGVRLGIVYAAKTASSRALTYMSVPALAIGIGFLTIYVMGWRQTGIEVHGERIWWNTLRPVHALLWISFGVCALMKVRRAWVILLLDTLIGLVAFVLKRWY